MRGDDRFVNRIDQPDSNKQDGRKPYVLLGLWLSNLAEESNEIALFSKELPCDDIR